MNFVLLGVSVGRGYIAPGAQRGSVWCSYERGVDNAVIFCVAVPPSE